MRLNEPDNPDRARSASASAAASARGWGKQAGRGGGQTARAGVRLGGFEGGQCRASAPAPRGFNKRNRKEFNEVNLAACRRPWT